MKAVVKKKKPRLLPRHIKARLEFAGKYKDWTIDDWKNVIFSDETKINRLGSDGRHWVWKKSRGRLTSQVVTGTVKFGGGSVMVWGCITYHGVGYACRIDGTMNAELYTSILSDELANTIEYYDMDRNKLVFQHDNDSKHRSQNCRMWLQSNKIELLDWPSQSPDLNPIEHLWWYLKSKLNGYEKEASGIKELWERVEREWEAIPAQTCVDLIESMPKRVDAVWKARGGYVKY